MPESASLSVLGAIYTLLSTDATLVALVGGASRITSGVPEGTVLDKYVLIGESSEASSDTFGKDGQDELVTIHTFVEDAQRRLGWKAALEISGRVKKLLHGTALAVPDHVTVLCLHDHTERFDDGPYRRVSSDFRVQTEDA